MILLFFFCFLLINSLFQNVLPIARKLAEKVIANCALKLKPCLMEAVQSIGAPLTEYSKIVAAVCQESSDVLEHNGVKVRGECSVCKPLHLNTDF